MIGHVGLMIPDVGLTVMKPRLFSLAAGQPWFALACATALFLLATSASGQTESGRLVVAGLIGPVTYSPGNQPPRQLKVGTALPQGGTIKTGPKAAVDLQLGNSTRLLRLTENTTLVLDRLQNTETGSGGAMEVYLDLQAGSLVGKMEKLPEAARLEVKVSNGIAGIEGGHYRINHQGFIVATSGALAFVHVGADGHTASHALTAPPAVYFSPVEGVRPAPSDLVREVVNQTRSRLPR
jgi:hypothetical protein